MINYKTKLFRGDGINTVEKEVNDFIKDKIVIDIKYEVTPLSTKWDLRSGTPVETTFYDSVLIIYSEVESHDDRE